MTVLAAYAASLVPALGWTLAHFLWQGALVALVLRFLLKTCATAKARHDLALAALVLMAMLPVTTFAWLKGDIEIVRVPAGFPGLGAGAGQGWEAFAVAAWLSGVAVLAARTAGGLMLIERLRRTATPLTPAWAGRCRALHRRMTGSLGVAFAQSEAIAAPLVAGWLKPMVLIPTAALMRLPADQLEALILHELAHVRRLDAIANLIQTVVETALFYHPAVWWVSRQVRIEREHCCDDLAVAAIADPALYVSALQAIEALRAAPYGVLAANGGDLKSRAARILGLAQAPERAALSRTAAILILTAAGVAMTHSAAVEAKPRLAATPAPAVATRGAPTGATRETQAMSPADPAPAPRVVLAEAAFPTMTPLSAVSAPAPQEPAPMVLATAAGPGPTQSVSPVVVTSQGKAPPADIRIDMAGSTDDPGHEVAIWPEAAYQGKYDGQVSLRCRFDTHGLAERCEVTSEAPAGRNFGKAALEMRTTFKIAPAMGADGPIEATKTVAIRFRAPDTQFNGSRTSPAFLEYGQIGQGSTSLDLVSGNPLAMRRVTMLDYPVWAQAASFDDLAAAYPAKGGGVEGYAVAHCAVQRSGALTGCQVIKEEPERRDFGQAALKLAEAKFRVVSQLAATHHATPLWVDVPIRMPPPAQLADRTVTAPAWITGVDARTTPKIFPPEAVASGLTTGRGIARCVVGPGGVLATCAPESAEPAGLGFAEAAARIASGMKINLWTLDAAPVEGGVVHVPVRLKLKGG